MNFKQGLVYAGKKRFEMTVVSYFTIYTSIMYFTGVLLVAAIQNPYPLEYFFHFPEYKSSFWEAFLSKLSQPEVKMHFRAAEVVLSRS